MENGYRRDLEEDMEEMSMQISQLQALTADLKAGLVGALQDLSNQKQSSCAQEERMRSYQTDIEEKILGIRNSLDAFKEDLSAALSQIKEVNLRHVAMQQSVELFQAEVGRHLLACQQRKNSKDIPLDCPPAIASETVPQASQHYPATAVNGSPQTTSSEQEVNCLQQGWARSPVWAEARNPTEEKSTEENRERYAAALELLESERLYVSHLSLLLKANITFNGAEAIQPKGKRPFPSSLRFLIQQHLELLHTLQERVLRFQWQGIMGDVFLRLFSKESDFLDFYVAYLKELPDCLAVVGSYSSCAEAAGLFEGDVTGKDSWLPLRNLLLQPVQRIPEYLTLLQSLLKLTEAEHPDYFLLLVCIQQLRAFTAQCGPLLQQSQELLEPTSREAKRQQQRQVKRRVPEPRRGRDPQGWESGGAPRPPSPFLGAEPTPWLRSFPEDPAREFVPPSPDPPGLEVLYEDGDSPGNASLGNASLSMFGNGSTASSDSSLDAGFSRRGAGGARGRLPEVDPAHHHRPLQAGQRKSKSLNGLQLDSSVCADGPLDIRSPRGGAHARLERQASRGSVGGKAQRSVSPLQMPEPQDLQRDVHKGAPTPVSPQATAAKLQLVPTGDCGPLAWEEEPRRRRGSEETPRSFSERSRKDDQKGGFRSSFRKLFKKKSSGEKAREKSSESEAHSDHESGKSPHAARPAGVDRGTAV